MHKLGIMGGSFDPIHFGHLHAAEQAKNEYNLDEVVFVTAYCPPHKSQESLAPAEHRVAMVELAIKDYASFKSSRIEFERGCYSYAGETIDTFKKIYNNNWQTYFITGLDAILTIIKWDKARTYPGICHFIAVARPGYDLEKTRNEIPDEFRPYISILDFKTDSMPISSTLIREKIKQKKSINGLVPPDVEEYIYNYSIYIE